MDQLSKRNSISNRILAELDELVKRSEEVQVMVDERLTRYSLNTPSAPLDKVTQDIMSYPEYFDAVRSSMDRIRGNLERIFLRINQSEL